MHLHKLSIMYYVRSCCKIYMWCLWCALSRSMSCCVKDCSDQTWQCNKCDQAYLQCFVAFSQSWLLSHLVFVGSAAAKILLHVFVRPASSLGTQPQIAVNHLVHSTPCTCQAIVASGGVMHIVDLENAFDSALSLSATAWWSVLSLTDPRVSFFCDRTKLITFEKCISLYFFIRSVYHTWKFKKRWEKVN